MRFPLFPSVAKLLCKKLSAASLLLLALLPATLQAQAKWPMGIKHVGAVYLEADKGELEIEVFKKDSADSPQSQRMRLFLAAPDGTIVDEFILPSHDFKGKRKEGGWGPKQSTTLRTTVDEAGVYTLLVTFEHYRYGEGAVWGFNTNARRYMLDAGGGHKDSARNERIMLNNPGVPGEICFMPQQGAFAIELTDLPKGVSRLTLLDADDNSVQELVVKDGGLKTVIAADKGNRNGVWRLLLPSQEVVAQIEGVTMWKDKATGDQQMALWTTSREKYFDLQRWYWLLRPRNLTRIVEKNHGDKVEYSVYNSGQEPVTVNLEPRVGGSAAEAVALGVKVQPQTLSLKPEETASVELSYEAAKIPAAGLSVRLFASAQGEGGAAFETYATLNLTHEAATRENVVPLQLKPWTHEAQMFGYQPDYPTGGEPYFSPDNTPWVIADQKIWYRAGEGQWVAIEGIPERVAQIHGIDGWQYQNNVTNFDADGGVYFLLRKGGLIALVRLADNGESLDSVLLPGNNTGGAYMERPALFSTPDGPPAIYRTIRTSNRPRVAGQRWGRNSRLEILVPEYTDGKLTMGEPIVVSELCVGSGDHSGAPSPIVSNGDKIHIIWGETSGAEQKHRGVPTFAGTWDRSGNALNEPVLLGYAPPVNDGHNVPAMVMDSKGTLHAVLGSHNQSFQYAESLQPDSTASWSKTVPVARGHSQSYVGLVIDNNDTLHLAYREWRRAPPFPDMFDAALYYQSKEPGKSWSRPQPLILPPLPQYSVWYHKLTNDREGRLFLSYDYWSTWAAYRAVDRGSMSKWSGAGRTLLFSDDGGKNWLLAEDSDFAPQAAEAASQ